MNFVFISSIDPLLLIPWFCVLMLAIPIVFYFRYFLDVNDPQIPSRYYDIKNKKDKRKAPCISKSGKDLPPERICPHPKNHVLDHPNCKDKKRAVSDKMPCISKVEKDSFPDISRTHPKGNTLNPRNNKGTRIIWAIVITALISIFWACIFAPLECLKACAGVSLAESIQFCFAFLFYALFPVTIFSFFVIIGERNNKKFLYYSVFVVVCAFLFYESTFRYFAFRLSLTAILFIYLIN